MNDIQTMINTMTEIARDERSKYHVTLGEIIDTLKEISGRGEGYRVVTVEWDGRIMGIINPHSYRGYYSDLAFEPVDHPTTVDEVLEAADRVLDTELDGWKGGDFLMHEGVPLWVAYEGKTGDAVMSVSLPDDHTVRLFTKSI